MDGSASESRKDNTFSSAPAARASRSKGSSEPIAPQPSHSDPNQPDPTPLMSSDHPGESVARAFGGTPPSHVLDLLRDIMIRLDGVGLRLNSLESGGRLDRRSTDGDAAARHSGRGRASRGSAGSDHDGSDGASALGADRDDGTGADRRMGALLAHTREVGRALRWPDWANAEVVLLRLLEGDAPVPIPGEDLVTERKGFLRRHAPQAIRGLQRSLRGVDVTAVALATLFVEPFVALTHDATINVLAGDMGVLLAWLYAEHDVSVQSAPGYAELTEREAFMRASVHLRGPPSHWLKKPADSTNDLTVCSAALNTKIPKALLDAQKLIRALVEGADEALEMAASAGSEQPVWDLVTALHKISALGKAGIVSHAESLLAQVTGATASEYKVDQRIKVDKALTARERAEADAKAVLKAQSDATAANEKIAAALVARQAPAVKWGAGAKGATTAGAAEASASNAQSSTPSKRYQKRNAGASKDGNANASAYKDANKSEKSPEKLKGDGAQ